MSDQIALNVIKARIENFIKNVNCNYEIITDIENDISNLYNQINVLKMNKQSILEVIIRDEDRMKEIQQIESDIHAEISEKNKPFGTFYSENQAEYADIICSKFIEDKQIIKCIKELRYAYNWGLKDAKNYLEEYGRLNGYYIFNSELNYYVWIWNKNG